MNYNTYYAVMHRYNILRDPRYVYVKETYLPQ